MKQPLILLMITLLISTMCTATYADMTGKAGKYSIELKNTPAQTVVGDNNFTIMVKDGEKPLVGGMVNIHADMPAMSMPSDFTTTPGKIPGEYIGRTFLSMEGEWKITIKVQQMDGMSMDGDGQFDFTVKAVKMKEAIPPPVSAPVQPAPNNTPYIVGGAILLLIIVIIGFTLGKKGNNK
ncbi:MAG: FixH family protein [bacterium]